MDHIVEELLLTGNGTIFNKFPVVVFKSVLFSKVPLRESFLASCIPAEVVRHHKHGYLPK